MVYINGNLVIAGACCEWTNGYGWADLTAGTYNDIRVIYSNGYGEAYIRLEW